MTLRTPTYLVGTPTGCVQNHTVSVQGDTSTSGTNGLKLADYRHDDGGHERTVFGTLTSGAHMNLFVYPYPGDTVTRHLEAVISAGSDEFVSATNSFSAILNGPFWGIEGVKVCAGTGTAIAYI